jgi:hypothetical protein
VTAWLRLVERTSPFALPRSTPAPKALSPLGSNRYEIDVLCPERGMTHFSFGRFSKREAEAVRVVRCPVCGGTHTLVSATAWVAGIAAAG